MLREQAARKREEADRGDPDGESPNPAPSVASTIRRKDYDGEDRQVEDSTIGLVDAPFVAVGPERGQSRPESEGGEQAAHNHRRNGDLRPWPEPGRDPNSHQPEREDGDRIPARQRIRALIEGERERAQSHKSGESPCSSVPGTRHTQTVSILESRVAICPYVPSVNYSWTAVSFEGTCKRDDRFAGWGLYDSCLNLRFKRVERDRGGQRLSLSWRSSLQAVS